MCKIHPHNNNKIIIINFLFLCFTAFLNFIAELIHKQRKVHKNILELKYYN